MSAAGPTVPPVAPPLVLADLLPSRLHKSILAVSLSVVWISLLSQVRVPLGFTPVPMTLGTFAVATVGGALGSRRAMLATAIYLLIGVVGVPVFQDGNAGWNYATGATMGYLLGYLVLAWCVGAASEHRADRHFLSIFGAIIGANLLLYTLGASWLAYRLNGPLLFGPESGFALGVRPFLVADLIKMVAAAALFPTAWRLVGERG